MHHKLASIHQIEDWGKFQAATPGRDEFWLLDKPNTYQALIIKQTLPFGLCWLYSPRGPLIDFTNQQALKIFADDIAALAKKHKAVFFRFDPGIDQKDEQYQQILTNLGNLNAHNAHAHYQPESTLIVDLTKSEEQILSEMKPKGRYNIKVAERHNVAISHSDSSHKESFQKDLKSFEELLIQTTKRDKFSGHSIEYYKNMIQILGSDKAKLWLATYDGKTVAAAIVTYFNETATYYFGVSSNQYRNTMAPYLLHWKIMQHAKKTGYKYYDFFGISTPSKTNPEDFDKDHPWASVTEFKLKFGGQRINYLPTQEITYKPLWYLMIIVVKFLKNLI